MDESLCFVHTRNSEQEAIYYIQETKTISEKFFTLILKRNRNLYWFSSFIQEKDKLATREKTN